jgi:hypothetical protein
MLCPYCNQDILPGTIHYCQDKPSMLIVTSEMFKRAWCWITRCNRGKQDKKDDEILHGTDRF